MLVEAFTDVRRRLLELGDELRLEGMAGRLLLGDRSVRRGDRRHRVDAARGSSAARTPQQQCVEVDRGVVTAGIDEIGTQLLEGMRGR